jgi:hypothetical protein
MILADFERVRIVRAGKEHKRVTVLVIDTASRLFKTELVDVKVERGVKIANAEHGVQKSHERPRDSLGLSPNPDGASGAL